MRIANELLMLFRSRKKNGREVSLYEPIGTDKEGNEISLLDILESSDGDIAEAMDFRRRPSGRLRRNFIFPVPTFPGSKKAPWKS